MMFYCYFFLFCSIPLSFQVILNIPSLGTLEGISGESYEAYLRIPYAKPPINELRFMPPISPVSWQDVLDSTSYPPGCFQKYQSDFNFYSDIKFSEDCLFLSIWKPTSSSLGNYPVVVWIHGGFFTYGAAAEKDIVGKYMAQKEEIVHVLIQYRLGFFGFAASPELRELNPERTTGNYGILDQIAALKWIKNYISVFGGDPNRITLAGESAGGASVAYHMLIKPSQGLFNQAIMQSPAPFLVIQPLRKSYSKTKKILNKICNKQTSDKLISCLHNFNAELIIDLEIEKVLFATIDGYVFTKHFYLYLKDWTKIKSKIKAVLIGNNKNEATIWLPSDPISPEKYIESLLQTHENLKNAKKSDIDKIIKEYSCKKGDCRSRWSEVRSDNWFNCPTNILAKFFSESSTKVFMYLFSNNHEDYKSIAPWLKSYHSYEIPFVFHNVKKTYEINTEEEINLSNRMAKSWGNFIKGNYNDFYLSNKETNFKRVEFKTPVTFPYPFRENWKFKKCMNVWLPIYKPKRLKK
jgi:para-nitrobenzyl esterase